MKALLISPKGKASNNPEFLKFWNENKIIRPYREMYSGSSLGLLILASYMKNDFEIEFIDENKTPIDFNKKYDLVAISCMTQQSVRAYRIADEFREKGVKVIIGGIHPTIMPDEAKLHADSVFIGEIENTWDVFKTDFFNNRLQPFYKSEDQADLSESPVPSYEILNPEFYKTVWIQTTRGCPHNCEFCASSIVFGNKYRRKKKEQVIEEIKKIKSLWKKPILINFADDNMFVDRKYSYDLLESIKELNIRWFAQTDISIAEDENLLKLIKESGAYNLFIGFESLTKEGLKFVDRTNWKSKKLASYSKSIKKIQSYGIGIMGAFITGLDTDTKRSFNKISNFIIKNHIYVSQISILTPFPGTRIRERFMNEGRILTSDWEKYTTWDVVYKPKKMTEGELAEGWLGTFEKIYNEKNQIKTARYFKNIYLKRMKMQ